MQLNYIYFELLAENKIESADISLDELGYNPSTDFHLLEQLASSLKTNVSVQTLDLMNCELSDQQLQKIALYLFQNRSIKNFILSHNHLTDISAEIIIDLIEIKKPEFISLHGNKFTEKTMDMINHAISTSKTLHRVSYPFLNDLAKAVLNKNNDSNKDQSDKSSSVISFTFK